MGERVRIEDDRESVAESVAEQLKMQVVGQDDAIEAITVAFDKARLRDERRPVASLMFLGPTGVGKCLGLGTPVLMADGRVKAVEDIIAGDQVMGPDSQPRNVQSITKGRSQMFRINPVKGDAWTCNEVHILTLKRTDTGEIKDVPLNEYLGWSSTQKRLYKQFSVGVDFGGEAELPVSPYFVGIWLGDGSKDLKSIRITKPDKEIAEAVEEEAHAFDCELRTYAYAGKAPTHSATTTVQGINKLTTAIRTLFPKDKEIVIPHAYLTASRRQRLELLAGLLDTDGYLANGGYEIVQVRQALSESIAYLARSLGFRVTSRTKTVNGKNYYRLNISGDCSVIPLRIERKKAYMRLQKKDVLRTGFSVEPIGEGDYAGFTLDGDGRFLLGDFTVTHNTQTAEALADIMAVDKLHPDFIRIDCAQFAQGHEVAALVGSPPGYVGREQNPILNKSIIEKPGSVVLFDEIEKGHPKLWNYLLQIMEGGRVKLLNSDETVHFNNAVVIMTSNVGAREMNDTLSVNRIGFPTSDGVKPEHVESAAFNALKRQFSPEFINRLDSVVTFRPLDDEQLHGVLDAHVERSNRRYMRLGNTALELSKVLKGHLIETAPLRREFGARPVLRNYEKTVESKLSRMLGKLASRQIFADYENESVSFYDNGPLRTVEDILAIAETARTVSQNQHDIGELQS